MSVHSAAAIRNAPAATVNAASKPRVWASEPTTNGAAALAMRPRL